MALGLRYAVFLIFSRAIHLQGGIDMRIWPYLSSRAINQKNKGTLLSSTFKVGEVKIVIRGTFAGHSAAGGRVS